MTEVTSPVENMDNITETEERIKSPTQETQSPSKDLKLPPLENPTDAEKSTQSPAKATRSHTKDLILQTVPQKEHIHKVLQRVLVPLEATNLPSHLMILLKKGRAI
jgi:hypothetical protein